MSRGGIGKSEAKAALGRARRFVEHELDLLRFWADSFKLTPEQREGFEISLMAVRARLIPVLGINPLDPRSLDPHQEESADEEE